MKVWIRIAAAAAVTVAVSGLVNLYGLEDTVFFNKGAASLGVFGFGFAFAPAVFQRWREEKYTFLAGYGLAFGLAFTEILGLALRLGETKGGVDLSFPGSLFMILAAGILAYFLEPCFHRAAEVRMKPREGWRFLKALSPRGVFLAAWGGLFAGWIPCALAFYPGLYCYDMSWQWAQFASKEYTTHHPLLHTVLSGGIIELGKLVGGSYERGLFFHSIVQLAFLSGCMAFGVRFLAKTMNNHRAAVLTWLFFLLFPYFPVMGVSTTKDTMFAGLFFVVFVCLCDMAAEGCFYRGRKLAAFVACAVVMCLFRNNAAYGLAVMAFCLCAVWGAQLLGGRGRKGSGVFFGKAIGLTVLCLVLSQAGFTALEKGLGAREGSRAEMLSLPMQQMARAYVYHKEEFSEEDREELLRFFDEESLLRYKYYVSDPVKAGMRMENFKAGEFAKLWFKLGRQFPGEYVKAPLCNMMGLWYLGGDSSCYLSYEMLPPFDQDHKVEIRSKLPRLKAYYSWFTDSNLQKYLPGASLFFYTSFYSWCVAATAGIMAAKKQRLFLILPLFLGSYGFTLVFGPCIIVRYFLGVMMCVPVLAVMTFQVLPEEGFGISDGPVSGEIQNPAGFSGSRSEG
ncbi:MAG: hypothetical protein HFG73_03260 [Hungatella sp.]|nr:hypothetical protein [Hungatella sp.]